MLQSGAYGSSNATLAESDAPHWTWSQTTFNTWTDYAREEESFDAFISRSRMSRSAVNAPPHNYLAVIRDMNYILSSLAATLIDSESNNTTGASQPACYLGAKLVAAGLA